MSKSYTDYYVYVHKRMDNGIAFYVGHGRATRCNQSNQNKTREWDCINAEAGGYTVELIHEGLTKEQAVELEGKYIAEPPVDWQLVNKNMPTVAHELQFEEMNELFYYDETSPSALRYKVNRYKNKGAISKRAGDVVGGEQYTAGGKVRGWGCKVTINGVKLELSVHRIVWLLHNKTLTNGLVIDHIDGNPLNNTIENLREVTYRDNAINRTNKKSAIGLRCVTRRKKDYSASYRNLEEKTITRSFSVKKYGEEQALYLAVKFRLQGLQTLEQEGLKYADNHVGMEDLLEIVNKYEMKHNITR